jgi:protein gp37
MSRGSKIEWTETTWNPVRGCTKISPGCKNCYAEVFAERFRGVPGHPFEQGFDLRLVPAMVTAPFAWTRPQRVFVNSMSDLFHKEIPDEYIELVCTAMQEANWHTYQVLTKRPDRMADLLTGRLSRFTACDNIWWGTTVEDAEHAALRIPHLARVPAARRFLSAEPLLTDLGVIQLGGVGWVIAGGESGRRARPIDADWVRSIRDQCLVAGVPFFFKQWGGPRKKETGKTLDGQTWLQYPTFVAHPVPARDERLRRKLQVEAKLQSVVPDLPKELIRLPAPAVLTA